MAKPIKRFKFFLPPEQAAAKKAKWSGSAPVRKLSDAERTALALAATAKVIPLGESSFTRGELAPRSPLDSSGTKDRRRFALNEALARGIETIRPTIPNKGEPTA